MAFNKNEWKPNPKQEVFLRVPWTIREALYGGGNGSGKSDVLLIYPLAHKLHENPRFKQVFQRRTYPELKNEIVPRSRELYRSFGAKFNRTDMCWTFPRPDQYGSGAIPAGALIFLAHCENEKDVHNFDSMEINLYSPDELTSFTQFIYEYIAMTRVRTSDETLPAIIRAAGMPGNIGHNFVKKRFIDPFKKGGRIIKGKGGNKRIYIHSTVTDNPHIDPNYAQALEGITNDAERKARKFGDWDAYLGTVFEEFRTQHFPDEPINAIHRIEAFPIPEWWPRIVVIDWGFAAMNYVTYNAISPTGRVFTYREQHWLKTKIEEWAPFVKEICDRENPRLIKVCKSAGQDRGQEHTIQQQISIALGREVQLSNNSPGSRVAGKQLMHEYLRWKPKYAPEGEKPVYNEDYALWIYRNRGEREYNSYLRTFADAEPETNLPKWQIFCCDADDHNGHSNCCPVLINAIQACSYDKPKNNKPAEDVAEFEGDDPYDNARYMLDSVEQYFEESKQEWEMIQKRAQLTASLESNEDWTTFYRNAYRLEHEQLYEPVRRYH